MSGLAWLAAGLAAMAVAAHAQPAPGGPLANAQMVQVTLPTHDLDRSIGFYRDTLGLPFLFKAGNAAFFQAGAIRLRFELDPKAVPASGEIYFEDPGLAYVAPLTQRGIRFLAPAETVQRKATSDVKLIEFTDPDGNAIGLLGEVPKP